MINGAQFSWVHNGIHFRATCAYWEDKREEVFWQWRMN